MKALFIAISLFLIACSPSSNSSGNQHDKSNSDKAEMNENGHNTHDDSTNGESSDRTPLK